MNPSIRPLSRLAHRPSAARRAAGTLAATLLAVGVGAAELRAAPVGGTPETFTIQPGAFSDPAVWDTGLVPTSNSVAFVDHDMTLSTPGHSVDTLVVQPAGLGPLFTLEDGGELTTINTYVGYADPAQVVQNGGTAVYGRLAIGAPPLFPTFNTGNYTIFGGSLSVTDMVLGDGQGTRGTLQVVGGDATLSVTDGIVFETAAELAVWPSENGAAGLTTVETGFLSVDTGAVLQVFPQYPAEVGDSWELVHASGTMVGDFTLENFGPYDFAVDTSTPGVLRVTVTSSPYPLPGNLCADALPLDPGGDVQGWNTGNLTTDDPTPSCGGQLEVAGDIWYRVENDLAQDRPVRVWLQFSTNESLELYDACGGALLDCAPVGGELTFEIPALGSRLLRVATTNGGAAGGGIVLTPWTDLGGGSPGSNGTPTLEVTGDLSPDGEVVIELDAAPPGAAMLGWLALGTSGSPTPALGGTLHAFPYDVQILRFADAGGSWGATVPWPPGAPSGLGMVMQFVVQDLSVPDGLTLSNAMLAVTP